MGLLYRSSAFIVLVVKFHCLNYIIYQILFIFLLPIRLKVGNYIDGSIYILSFPTAQALMFVCGQNCVFLFFPLSFDVQTQAQHKSVMMGGSIWDGHV